MFHLMGRRLPHWANSKLKLMGLDCCTWEPTQLRGSPFGDEGHPLTTCGCAYRTVVPITTRHTRPSPSSPLIWKISLMFYESNYDYGV